MSFERASQAKQPSTAAVLPAGKLQAGRDFELHRHPAPLQASPQFGHDFSRIAVHRPFSPDQACAPQIQAKLAISQPGDDYEEEADRVAEAVVRAQAGENPGLTRSAPPGLQRQEGAKPKPDTEKYTEAATKVGEAFLETDLGKKLKAEAARLGTAFLGSLAGKIITGAAAAGTVSYLAATHGELPLQVPEIPLDALAPGLKVKVTYKGPVDRPAEAAIAFSIPLGGSKEEEKKPALSDKEKYRAETARIAAEQEKFREGLKTPEQRAQEKELFERAFWSTKTPLGLEPIRIPGLTPAPQLPRRGEETLLMRQAEPGRGSATPQAAPPVVHEVLNSSGQPLDRETRAFMEPRFGHDFSQVRVHTDVRAAESANAVNALAYTIGRDIVFAPGRYAPANAEGRRLLAHELTHVAQQALLPEKFGGTIQRIVLTEEELREQDLENYLKGLMTPAPPLGGPLEAFRSFDKARAIIALWKQGRLRFNLTAQKKTALLKEFLAVFQVKEDLIAVLEMLEFSEGGDLRYIFGPGGIDAKKLDQAFGGDEQQRLRRLFDQRFKGGLQGLQQKGDIETTGVPAQGAPKFPYSWSALKAKFEGVYTVEELDAYIKGLPEAERQQAIKDMQAERVTLDRSLNAEFDKLVKEKKPQTLKEFRELKEGWRPKRAVIDRIDLVLEKSYLAVAEAEGKEELVGKTRALKPEEKAAVKEALTPEGKAKTGNFKDPAVYEQKIRDRVPIMIQEYLEFLKAEDLAKAPKRPLEELAKMANTARDEVDAVFSKYKPGKEFKAGKNLVDQREQAKKEQRTKAEKTGTAREMLFYLFQNDSVVKLSINPEHNASPEFQGEKPVNDEAKILEKIGKDTLKVPDNITNLLKINNAWPGAEGGGIVRIQAVKKSDPTEDRKLLWDQFYTIIHEYLHTLVDEKYLRFAQDLGGEKSLQGNTLLEGVDSLLTETVWAKTKTRVESMEIRQKVEPDYVNEPFDEALLPKFPSHRYPSYTQAMGLVSITGIHNLYAAYFLGEVELIRFT